MKQGGYPLITRSRLSKERMPVQYTFIDTIGLLVLCALLIVQPFHFAMTERLTYYREIFAVTFSLLIIHNLLKYFLKYQIGLSMRPEVFYIFLSLFTLIFFALFDPGVNLYGFDATETSENLLNVNLTLYVLRNALLYIPMVCYLALRGLSEKELKLLAGIVALVAPFSIVAFLYDIEFLPSKNIMDIVSLGGYGLQRNTYVSYLTFPFIASLYLVVELRIKIFKLSFLAVELFIFLYMMVSGCRQGMIFCIFMTLLMLMCVPTKNKAIKCLLFIIACSVIFMVANYYATSEYNVHDVIEVRYSSVAGFFDTGGREEIIKDGLGLLNVQEYLVGAGLSSVIISGPHNDFIRWTQRIGIPGMVLSFLPFFLSALHVFRYMQRKKKRPMLLFILSALFFTIYHSCFGYPREDAYQALYAFLGLALWLAISKSEPISNHKMHTYLHSR